MASVGEPREVKNARVVAVWNSKCSMHYESKRQDTSCVQICQIFFVIVNTNVWDRNVGVVQNLCWVTKKY